MLNIKNKLLISSVLLVVGSSLYASTNDNLENFIMEEEKAKNTLPLNNVKTINPIPSIEKEKAKSISIKEVEKKKINKKNIVSSKDKGIEQKLDSIVSMLMDDQDEASEAQKQKDPLYEVPKIVRYIQINKNLLAWVRPPKKKVIEDNQINNANGSNVVSSAMPLTNPSNPVKSSYISYKNPQDPTAKMNGNVDSSVPMSIDDTEDFSNKVVKLKGGSIYKGWKLTTLNKNGSLSFVHSLTKEEEEVFIVNQENNEGTENE